jgi:hypothetical protein
MGEIGTTTLPSSVEMWVLVSVCFYTLQYKENPSFFPLDGSAFRLSITTPLFFLFV